MEMAVLSHLVAVVFRMHRTVVVVVMVVVVVCR
jgi:hypothetical protein